MGKYSRGYFLMLVALAALAIAGALLQHEAVFSRLYRHRREILLLATSLVVSLALVEGSVRAFDAAGISYFEEGARYELDKEADPVLVYRHAAGLRRSYQGVDVTTNEIGLRERLIEGKRDGELRILLVGDSVVFGWGVPFEATLGQRLEKRLRDELRRPVRVLNSGVGSYNTVQELAFMRQRLEQLKPDAVVLIYVGNDIEPRDPPFDPWSQASLRGKSPPEVIRLVMQKSWAYRLAHFTLQRHMQGPAGAPFDHNSRGVRESMQALSDMASLCRDRGIGFEVIFYQRPDEDSAALVSEIRATGARSSFAVQDVKPWWGDAGVRSVTRSIVDTHPNALGYDILSKGLARYLIAQQIDKRNATAHGSVGDGAAKR